MADWVEPASTRWVTLALSLPVGKKNTDRKERKALFDRFDVNGNKYLSFAEVNKGLIETFQEDNSTQYCKPAILRAFAAAKDLTGNTEGHHADYVTRSEFRLLLVYIHRYFELFAIFQTADRNLYRRIGYAEFARAVPTLQQWGVVVRSPAAEFK